MCAVILLIGIEILNPEDYPIEKILKPTIEEYNRKGC